MKEQLKQIFDENADCYSTMVMQDAMTSDKFIEVVSELMKPTPTWVEIKSEDDLPLKYFNPMIPIPVLLTIKNKDKFETISAYFYKSFKKFFYDTDIMNEVSYDIIAWIPHPKPFKQ